MLGEFTGQCLWPVGICLELQLVLEPTHCSSMMSCKSTLCEVWLYETNEDVQTSHKCASINSFLHKLFSQIAVCVFANELCGQSLNFPCNVWIQLSYLITVQCCVYHTNHFNIPVKPDIVQILQWSNLIIIKKSCKQSISRVLFFF